VAVNVGGKAGSGGADGTSTGGLRGGGGGGARISGYPDGCPAYTGQAGGGGAVRIIWPGCARSFPSTRTTNE
jgi:hypothetical protein